MDIYIVIYAVTFLEIICAIVGTYYFIKTKNKNINIVISLLWTVVIVELLGFISRLYGLQNVYLYNFLSIFEIFIWSIIFFRNSNSIKFKQAIVLLTGIGILGIISEFILLRKLDPSIYLSYGINFLRFLIVIYSTNYISTLVKNNNITRLKPIFLFWISLGLLIYNACSIPFNGLVNLLVTGSIGTNTLLLIPSFLSIGMYSIFIIGFIWGNHQNCQ